MQPKVPAAVYILTGSLVVIAAIIIVAVLIRDKEITVTGEIVESLYCRTLADGDRSAIVVRIADGTLYYLAAHGDIDEFMQGESIEVTFFPNNSSMNTREIELVENPDGSKTVRTYTRYWWSIKRYRILSSNPD